MDGAYLQLPLGEDGKEPPVLAAPSGRRAIEDREFPFEALSDIAEAESWRKEINRPLSHIHKWWAQRLGTVFRAMTIGAFAPAGSDVLDLFYKPVRIRGGIVFDPFMGSGTTVAEAIKLGARGIGRDINPVAFFLVRCALSLHDRKAILSAYEQIERDVADEIRRYYKTTLPDGTVADVLYYFWVKTVDCPECTYSVELFSSMIFARHAYAKRFPDAKALCPACGEINSVRFDCTSACCASCFAEFDPSIGPAKGQSATCPSCRHVFPIAKTIRQSSSPPAHRLYAKLVLKPDGTKEYMSITDEDRSLYSRAQHDLSLRKDAYPRIAIQPGHNTNQALGYNYRYWHEMFNDRQLLGLSVLAERIAAISDPVLRDLFTCLFSGSLEFNNMFASYKGEGTGAVRHMFAHHILKPERVPLEANLWGTPKSSGSFSTMFEGRIKRALDYAENPFELMVANRAGQKQATKVFGLSDRIGFPIAKSYDEFRAGSRVYLSCGDSGETDLPDGSVDAVLSDPPFFDNVHYSQLADFFHVWQRHILGAQEHLEGTTTRSTREVQNSCAEAFTVRLASVWREASRVLKEDGVLAFTYHHSRPEGWRSVLEALMTAGLVITATQPIKAEMSVAMPKQQAKEPIDLDIIVVCRKRSNVSSSPAAGDPVSLIAPIAREQSFRLIRAGRRLSRNDVRIIVMAQLLQTLSLSESVESAVSELDSAADATEQLIGEIYESQGIRRSNPTM